MMQLGRILDIEAEYPRSFLVETLKKNKAKHIEEFKEATENYNKELEVKLKDLRKAITRKLKSGNFEYSSNGNVAAKNLSWGSLKKPVDASKMYDQYITLFENMVTENVKLSTSDANSLINDEWDWAVAAKITNSFYSNSSVRGF